MNAEAKKTAHRRRGPWTPIEPTIVPCKTFYTDALCADVPHALHEHGQRLKGISKLRLLTPRQRCKASWRTEQ